ncbi:MAG: cytochrome c biogenesis protein ResB [Thermomicrobiales bacterium]|nr:cytochrome c biogenesis protein ResB [Thermomicrobiales bacterium]
MDEQLAPAAKRAARERNAFDMVVDRVWRFFCSTRVAVAEIAWVALLVLIGTLRQSSVPHWIGDNIPGTKGIVIRWLDWDVFHSFIFMISLAVLSVGIFIGGMLNRMPGMWQTIRNPTIRTTRGFLNGVTPAATVAAGTTPDGVIEAITAALKKKRYRVFTEKVGDATHLYADKNSLGQLGTYPFHLAMIIILAGGIVTAQWGFRELQFIVPEGGRLDVGHGTGLSVELVQFVDTYAQTGVPEDYRSDIVILKDGEPVKSGSITVNHPLSYENATVYQSSFGQAVQVRVTDANGNVILEDALPMMYQSLLNPDAPAARIDLLPVNASLVIIGPDSNPFNQPELDTLNVRSGEMWVQVRSNDLPAGTMPPAAIVAQGHAVTLDGVTVEFIREKRFSLMQVAYNPGIPIFIFGGIMLVAGLAAVFYFPLRRIRGIIEPAPDGGATGLIAPLAKRDWSGQQDFEHLMEQLKAEPAFTIEPKIGKDAEANSATPETDVSNDEGTA